MAGGEHRQDGTGRDGTGRGSPSTLPPKAVAPAAPRRRRNSLRLSGSGSAPSGAPRPGPPLLLRPPPPRGRAGPPHAAPPAPAPLPRGCPAPPQHQAPGREPRSGCCRGRQGSPGGVRGWGRAAWQRDEEGERLPCRNQGVPKGKQGHFSPRHPRLCPSPPPVTQLWEGSLGRVQQPGESLIGQPLSLPLSVGKQWRNGGFDPILMSAETAAGRACWRGRGQGMPVCQGL